MGQVESGTQKEYLFRLSAELDKTLAAYREVIALRQKTIEQDMEQIKVYCDIIEKQPDLKLNPMSARRLNRLLSKDSLSMSGNVTSREKQDELEGHFLKLQEALVSLISRQFKYR